MAGPKGRERRSSPRTIGINQRRTTMNAKTFDERTKPYKGTKALQMVKEWVRTGSPIRPCYTTGSGKHTSNSDHARAVHSILFVLSTYPTKEGNDAPRGGATGAYIIPAHWGRFKPVRDAWATEVEAVRAKEQAEKDAQRKAQAARYADIVGDHHAVLIAWWEAEEYHPAPIPVMNAKAVTGMTWKQIRNYCRANATITTPNK